VPTSPVAPTTATFIWSSFHPLFRGSFIVKKWVIKKASRFRKAFDIFGNIQNILTFRFRGMFFNLFCMFFTHLHFVFKSKGESFFRQINVETRFFMASSGY
jgi:hypothetical protein